MTGQYIEKYDKIYYFGWTKGSLDGKLQTMKFTKNYSFAITVKFFI